MSDLMVDVDLLGVTVHETTEILQAPGKQGILTNRVSFVLTPQSS
jgi:hypothetical protein